jgi:flagellin-like hook-associated protein FlgL
MHINTDLSADTLALSLQQQRSEAAGASSQASAGTQSGATASQLDPLLQRLTEGPSSVQDANLEVQDGSEATQVMNALVQSMRGQPETAMAAQANQLSENVLSLLQSTG